MSTPTAKGNQKAIMSTLTEAHRRRTFAVIAHPDAGKSTLTEALALHAHVISEAGAVHGKAGRKATVSDWMEMEKDRGISIASSALQFEYAPTGHTGEPYMINLVDTPGHADFSEDTYRVLTAVDAAVMLIDAAKGLEPQTLKLFRVCKARGLPIVTVINKWDRPGRTPLELVDEIVSEIGLQPTPLYWPVGAAGDFRGLARITDDGSVEEYIHFVRTAGGSTIAPEEHYDPTTAADREGEAWDTAAEEVELLAADGAVHDQELFLNCITSPNPRRPLRTRTPAGGSGHGRRRVSGGRIGFLRGGIQSAGRHGQKPPRFPGVYAHRLRRIRPRHAGHTRPIRPELFDEIRPDSLRPRPIHRRNRLPGRHRAHQRH